MFDKLVDLSFFQKDYIQITYHMSVTDDVIFTVVSEASLHLPDRPTTTQ